MLLDYEISKFQEWLEMMVSKLGLEDNQRVCDLYAMSKNWATTYICGHFFGGFRTTSRCERLHSMLGKFVHSCNNLRDFIEQFFHCISQMRSRECQTDLESVVGDLVLPSLLHTLERSAANILTREILSLQTDVDKGVQFEGLIMHTHINTWSKNARSIVRAFMDKGSF
ncbi:hypothetical protein Ahy_B06g082317 isoform A [Arachis hypogaea]|uniref:Protein FAR1-RELATED SEQUENCE n=1 Tax=Arachis hypogaea TaxID=3818 RepID=A0A444YND0_ARAHY|nr:hypothetical protein Ahy_B06g082317 isoform A [Arachis hypogaea]